MSGTSDESTVGVLGIHGISGMSDKGNDDTVGNEGTQNCNEQVRDDESITGTVGIHGMSGTSHVSTEGTDCIHGARTIDEQGWDRESIAAHGTVGNDGARVSAGASSDHDLVCPHDGVKYVCVSSPHATTCFLCLVLHVRAFWVCGFYVGCWGRASERLVPKPLMGELAFADVLTAIVAVASSDALCIAKRLAFGLCDALQDYAQMCVLTGTDPAIIPWDYDRIG